MNTAKTSLLSNGLIWFGAAVSIAEILTGTLIAPLGFQKGLAAILIGHLIGCALLYLAGLIGAKTNRSSMETVKLSFGQKGALLFCVLNILQLTGWTAVMIANGAAAASSVAGTGSPKLFSIAIGALIILWILVGIKNLGKLNLAAMTALFILTVALSAAIFNGAGTAAPQGLITFGAAVELSVAMPLSWLPLIADYTRHAKRSAAASFASAAIYFTASCWMYTIGMCMVLFTGETDLAAILLKTGFGIAGLVIIIFSTVTTTFLDAYSAGISSVSIFSGLNEKAMSIMICILGTILAIFAHVAQYESFLYLIGSVFAPMIAIQITDYFILHKNRSHKKYDGANLVIWAVGFILYRLMMNVDTPVGSTAPVMIITALLCIANFIVNKKIGGTKNDEKNA